MLREGARPEVVRDLLGHANYRRDPEGLLQELEGRASRCGWTVNAPPWDFGKLLGICVVFFFIFAQVTSWLVFKQIPSVTVLIGGSLIIAGGVVISLAKA
jgi:hypothetical protein